MTDLLKIDEICQKIKDIPKLERVQTDHYFSDGMYCRKLTIEKGVILIGRKHKKEHFFMCMCGKLEISSENGNFILNAGDVLCSKAGTQRIVFSHEDSIMITVHKTNNTNLDEIESEIIEEGLSFYNSSNVLKELK